MLFVSTALSATLLVQRCGLLCFSYPLRSLCLLRTSYPLWSLCPLRFSYPLRFLYLCNVHCAAYAPRIRFASRAYCRVPNSVASWWLLFFSYDVVTCYALYDRCQSRAIAAALLVQRCDLVWSYPLHSLCPLYFLCSRHSLLLSIACNGFCSPCATL